MNLLGFLRRKPAVKSRAYLLGFHARLYPHDATPPGVGADEWQQGYAAADELMNRPRKPTMYAHLTIDGMIDMHVMIDGVTVARVQPPTRTGEEAEIIVRAWWAELQAMEAIEEGEDEV